MPAKCYLVAVITLVVVIAANGVEASEESVGVNGINSAALSFDGTGVAIGQVEAARPGKYGYDTDSSCCNEDVVPAGVYFRDGVSNPNQDIDNHALWVASVMISTQTAVEPMPPDRSPPVGVAQGASLYSSAFIGLPLGNLQQQAAVAAQHLAKHLAELPSNPVDIPAINMSIGLPLDSSSSSPDGNSTLTQFIDWSARLHDVVYVVAGNELADEPIPVPTDNYNGITVAASRKDDNGVYRIVTQDNEYGTNVDAAGDRTSTDIVAPGFLMDVAGANGSQPSRALSTGTSFAAPHVSGTVALLQEYAATQMPGNANARRHEVMKAVIMNSADKIKDDGSLALPGSFLGMTRTVEDKEGKNWLQSEAYTGANKYTLPLDNEMGAGHLNASRAVTQLGGGEHDSNGTATVPLVGWDYGHVDDDDPVHKYVFNQQLQADSYVSLTLAWDREVIIDFDAVNPGQYDPDQGETFYDFSFYDVNLYLLPAGATDNSDAVWASTSEVSNLEHIFAPVPQTGNYEFWVELQPTPFAYDRFADYAVAWWAATVGSPVSGDYDGNGSVGPEDYDVWKANYGTSYAAADGNGDGIVDAADYTVWRDNLTAGSGSLASVAVPEPTAAVLWIIGVVLLLLRRRNG